MDYIKQTDSVSYVKCLACVIKLNDISKMSQSTNNLDLISGFDTIEAWDGWVMGLLGMRLFPM